MKTNKITTKLNAYTRKHPRRAKAIPIVLIAIIGISTLLISQAATFSVALEPELASNKTGVTTPSGDSTASGNSYVQFGTGSTATSEFPTAATTGWEHTGVTLTAYTGPTTITTAGTVIDSKEITSCIVVLAPNVTIKRSRIRCSGDKGIDQKSSGGSGTNLLIEDTTVTSSDRAIQIEVGQATIRRVKIIDTLRGIWLGSNTTVEDTYIYAVSTGSPDSHSSGIVSHNPISNLIIRNNTIKATRGATAALAIEATNGRSSYWTVDHNLFATDANWCVYWDATNIKSTNNQYSTEFAPNCGVSGPNAFWNDSFPGMVWSNNTWYDGPNKGKQMGS